MTEDEQTPRTHEVRPRSGEKDAKIAVVVGGLLLLGAAGYFFLAGDNHSDNNQATPVQEAAHAGLVAGPSRAVR